MFRSFMHTLCGVQLNKHTHTHTICKRNHRLYYYPWLSSVSNVLHSLLHFRFLSLFIARINWTHKHTACVFWVSLFLLTSIRYYRLFHSTLNIQWLCFFWLTVHSRGSVVECCKAISPVIILSSRLDESTFGLKQTFWVKMRLIWINGIGNCCEHVLPNSKILSICLRRKKHIQKYWLDQEVLPSLNISFVINSTRVERSQSQFRMDLQNARFSIPREITLPSHHCIGCARFRPNGTLNDFCLHHVFRTHFMHVLHFIEPHFFHIKTEKINLKCRTECWLSLGSTRGVIGYFDPVQSSNNLIDNVIQWFRRVWEPFRDWSIDNFRPISNNYYIKHCHSNGLFNKNLTNGFYLLSLGTTEKRECKI